MNAPELIVEFVELSDDKKAAWLKALQLIIDLLTDKKEVAQDERKVKP